MPNRTITRWLWRSRLPGGRWQRDRVPMTEEEAARSAKAYEPLGIAIEMEKIPDSERHEPEPTGIPLMTSRGSTPTA